MARNQQEQRNTSLVSISLEIPLDLIHHGLVLTLSRAGDGDHGSRQPRTPVLPRLDCHMRQLHVKFQIAANLHTRNARIEKALRIRF